MIQFPSLLLLRNICSLPIIFYFCKCHYNPSNYQGDLPGNVAYSALTQATLIHEKILLVLPLSYIMNLTIFAMLNYYQNYCNILLTYFFSFHLTVCIEQQELSFNKDVNQIMSLLCSKWFSDSTVAPDIGSQKEYHSHLSNVKADKLENSSIVLNF